MRLKFSGSSINLSKIGFLVADPSELYRELFRRLLHGFGAKTVHEASDVTTAQRILRDREVDFLICAADLPKAAVAGSGADGIDVVRAIRLDAVHRQRTIPIIITMGTARRISVGQARDSGANFVLSKPVSPTVFYDRIVWIARSPRPFWENDAYFGPDRRFREPGQKGAPKRRRADKAEVEAVDVG
jgi:two-component system, chemotaxis family, chemotaxis protein CheY